MSAESAGRTTRPDPTQGTRTYRPRVRELATQRTMPFAKQCCLPHGIRCIDPLLYYCARETLLLMAKACGAYDRALEQAVPEITFVCLFLGFFLPDVPWNW